MHTLFRAIEIFLRQGVIEVDVVIEAVIDNRTNRHFGVRPKLFHRMAEKMRAGVANNFQTGFIFSGNDRDGRIFRDRIDRVHQLAVNATRDAGFRQTRTDILRDLHYANGAIVAALTAVRKSNYRHFISLNAVVTHTKDYMQTLV